MTLLLAAFVIAQNPGSNFPDIPENHFVYDALNRFHSEGLLPEYDMGLLRGNRPLTRWEVAEFIVHAELNLSRRVGALVVRKGMSSADLSMASEVVATDSLDVDSLHQITPIFLSDFPAFVSGSALMSDEKDLASRLDSDKDFLSEQP